MTTRSIGLSKLQFRRSVAVAVASLAAITMVAATVRQERIDLDQFDDCDCTLNMLLDTKLGDADGPGVIESASVEVAYDGKHRRYAVFRFMGTEVKLFDNDGTYITSFGRSGSGPGEIRLLTGVQFAADGRMVLQDAGNDKWLVVGEDGTMLAEHRLSFNPGQFIVVGDDAVLASFGSDPASAGFPLHRVSVRDGKRREHFGSTTGEWSAGWDQTSPLVARMAGDSVWLALSNRLQFELWSYDNRLMRVVTGQPKWFPVARRAGRQRASPATSMVSFAVDSGGRLWVMSRVADQRWATASKGPEGAITDLDSYLDSRVDVFDLRGHRLLGSRTWDDAHVLLVVRGGEVLTYQVDYDVQMNPHVALSRVEFAS